MFNDIQKKIEEKKEKEAKEKQEASAKRVKSTGEEIVKLLKERGLTVSEALYTIEAIQNYINGSASALLLTDVVKD